MAKSKAKKKVEENGQEILDKKQKAADKEQEKAAPKEEMEIVEKSETEQLQEQLEEQKDKYLRLYSEFDNYRRRTSKERLEIIRTASEELIVALLPVLDDFERAIKAVESNDETTEKEGVELIYHKLIKVLELKGVKALEVKSGDEFNDEYHEAISQIPAPSGELKGKIVDVVEQGYLLDEKVIRFAKVVTGA